MTKNGRRVLVIDDEKMIRDVVLRIMKIKGHETAEAVSGDEAVKILQEDSKFDYAILDLSMPGEISGAETFDIIRNEYPEINVIISTGYIEQVQIDKFLENGAHGILEKPYKIDDIMELIS